MTAQQKNLMVEGVGLFRCSYDLQAFYDFHEDKVTSITGLGCNEFVGSLHWWSIRI